eukprot:TRINITY_DN7886_c0_g1_i1.p1 TRINITY_DN7886_c0_g1~~TRINITY_DN7886_c0_g1_i1.p1  ORF type:complete len:219 (-),score=19.49 TRINITY_DN7886_c0_g1_i1:226-882(-)
MAPVTLYGMGMAGVVRRPIAALYEMNVEDFNHVSVNSVNGESHQPEHLARQPFGKIPVLEVDGAYIFESRAIMRYVADKYSDQGPNLLGKDALERGLVNQWIDVEGHSFTPEVLTIAVERCIKPFFFKAEPDEAKIETAKGKLAKVLDVYEKHLEGREYLVGDSYTLADLTHVPFTEVIQSTPDFELFTSRPNVKAWWERISTRPAWKKVQENFPMPF